MKETELAEHFINYLSDFDIYKEVPAGGIIDIMAVRGNIVTSVEVKLSLNFEVIQQAFKNKSYSHYAYIAVPYTRSKSFAFHICKEYGIGLLMLIKHSYSCREDKFEVQEYIKPNLNRKIYRPKLADYMKESIAGSQNDRITAFKNTIRLIDGELKRRNGIAHIKDVLKSVEHHYSSMTSANQCIINMCRGGVIKEFYYEAGNLISNSV